MSRLNILLSCAGRRVELLRCIRADMDDLGLQGRIVATDASDLTSAGHLADSLHRVPPVHAPDYIDVLCDVVIGEQIGLVIPTIDTELPVLARAFNRLRLLGTEVLTSGSETVRICRDKVATHAFLEANDLPCPRQWSPNEALELGEKLPFPVVIKPRYGSSSVGVTVASKADEVPDAITDDDIIQTLARGQEYTVDVWADADGSPRSIVPRQRLEIRGGEVSKAITKSHPEVIDLARAVALALPDARGPLTIQIFADGDYAEAIEINPRFGGGYPLSWKAGARTTRWALQAAVSAPVSPVRFDWTVGLIMLRYDDSVFLEPQG